MAVNRWIEHVKNYAQKNNISYSCALSLPDCKNTYKKVDKKKSGLMKKREFLKKIAGWGDEFIRDHKKLFNKMDEDELYTYRRKFNLSGKEFKNYIQDKAPEIYKQLIITKHKKPEE